jgi:Ca2+-binding EF-hand superfamily protein
MKHLLAVAILGAFTPWTRAADVDVVLRHEKEPPVVLRLRVPAMPAGAEVRVRTLPAAQPGSAALTRALFGALDRDGDGKLTQAELRAAEKLLSTHDTDEDGCLTPLELVPGLLTVPGTNRRPRFDVELRDRKLGAEPEPLLVELKQGGPGVIRAVGALTLDLAAAQAPPDEGLPRGRKETKRPVYTLWVVPQARGWFERLDANGDGQLSLAELRAAWERLADADARKRGYLTLPDPSAMHYTLTLQPGDVARHGVRLRRPEAPVSRGPAWFVAMDRNGDGYVSRDEFLGPEKEFLKLDRDGDGLISPEEAGARK